MATYESIIHLASIVTETDYYANERSIENLGLAEMSIEQLKHYFITGEYPFN